MLADFFGQCDEQWALRWHSGSDAVQFLLVGGKAGQSFVRRRIAFVGNIVGTAGETIDCLDRPAQVRGH